MPRVTQSVLAGGAGASTERGGKGGWCTVKDGRDREEEEEREDEGGKDDFG